MIVARHDQHAAVGRTAVGVAVLERIARTVDSGSLAVPESEHPVDLAVRVRLHLLRTEHRRGGEVLVYGRQELDVVFVKKRFGTPELLVEPAEWRSAVAADESRRIEPGRAVHRPLHERNAHQRLCTRQEDTSGFAPVAVEKLVVVQRKGGLDLVCSNRHRGITSLKATYQCLRKAAQEGTKYSDYSN